MAVIDSNLVAILLSRSQFAVVRSDRGLRLMGILTNEVDVERIHATASPKPRQKTGGARENLKLIA